MKPTRQNLEKRIEALENRDATDNATETPTGVMLVPFGASPLSDERLETLEAEERARQGRPTGSILVPYREEPTARAFYVEPTRARK